MKRLVFILFCLYASAAADAQYTWLRCYGDPNCTSDILPCAAACSGNTRLAVAARLTSCASSPLIGTFACHYLDHNGQVLWKKVSYENRTEITTDIAFLSDNNIAVEYMQGETELGISWAKFDTLGNLLFNKNLAGKNMVSARMICNDNAVYLTGYLWNPAGKATGVLAKYLLDGTLLFVKYYETTGANVYFKGGFILNGSLFLYGTGRPAGYSGSMGMIVKTDFDGNVLEEHYYQYYDCIEYAEVLPNKRIAAIMQSNDYPASGQNFVYFFEQDLSPAALFRFYYVDANRHFTLTHSADGRVYAGGYVHSPSGEEDSYIHCFTDAGQYLWTRSNRFPTESDRCIDLCSADECHLWGVGWRANTIETVQRMDPDAVAGTVDTVALSFVIDTNYQMVHIQQATLVTAQYNLSDTVVPLILDTSLTLDVLCVFEAPVNYPGCVPTALHTQSKNALNCLYPNPSVSGQILTVPSLSGCRSYIIYDLQGRIILEGVSDERGNVRLMNIMPGSYWIKDKLSGESNYFIRL